MMAASVSAKTPDPPGRGSTDSERVPHGLFAPSERERLIEAMAACCAEQGYSKTTVEQVVARAGVPAKAFGKSFADKEECGLAAVNELVAAMTAAASNAYSADSSEWESVMLGAKALLELMAARPALARMGYIESRQTMSPRAFELYKCASHVIASMIDRLRAFPAADHQQPVSAARAALGGAETVVRRELVAGRTERLPDLLPDMIYAVVVPFLGREEALRQSRMAREMLDDA
jgi:AcrR family transcriptional regulator